MTEISDEILEGDVRSSKNELPMFLNVLTILTFIGSGFGVNVSIYNFATIEQQIEQQKEDIQMLEKLVAMDNNPFMGADMLESMKVMYENIYLIQGTALLVAIGCLIGAFMMRKLQKNGFYIYTAACVIGVAVPLAVIGFGMMGMMIVLGSVFSIAFIIMYGVNYKYMH